MRLNCNSETAKLKTVVLGLANSNGATPAAEEAYDPKSLEHILKGTYPKESDMIVEIEGFAHLLEKYGVTVFRPQLIENCNQIFVRDIGFVIGDVFIQSNILPNRIQELDAVQYLVDQINPGKVVYPPEFVHIEGGDVILWKDYIFIGTYYGSDYADYVTARTNAAGVQFVKDLFPDKKVKAFDLIKSKIEARDNALHLDCCFQPIGNNKGIIYKRGFREEADYLFLLGLFGAENLFHVTRKEMYHMNCNVFSIDENVVVSEKKFRRLNKWLKSNGFVVEKIDYSEIAKQEGLLRCSTLPLERE